MKKNKGRVYTVSVRSPQVQGAVIRGWAYLPNEFSLEQLQKDFDNQCRALMIDGELVGVYYSDAKTMHNHVKTVELRKGQLMEHITRGSKTVYRPYKIN